MGAGAAATSSSTAATTSGVTSHPSNPFAVGADVFEVQPKPSVPVATASTPSGAAVTPSPQTQNTVVPGADAVQGSTLPVGVAVAGVPSTTTATLGSAATDVKSTLVELRSRFLLVLRVSRQPRRRLPVPVLVRRLVLRRRHRRRSVTRQLPVHPSSSCVSSRQFVRTPARLR